MASSSMEQEHVFIGPGLSPFKRIVTILGILGIVALVLWIAFHQGLAASIGSTIAAILFITGFMIYLRIVAPVPFTITLTPAGIVKRSRNGEVIDVPWENLARIKEEQFPNGKLISVAAYRKVTSAEQKAKAWVVYRDDVTDLDGLSAALKQAIPDSCAWQRETVHE